MSFFLQYRSLCQFVVNSLVTTEQVVTENCLEELNFQKLFFLLFKNVQKRDSDNYFRYFLCFFLLNDFKNLNVLLISLNLLGCLQTNNFFD